MARNFNRGYFAIFLEPVRLQSNASALTFQEQVRMHHGIRYDTAAILLFSVIWGNAGSLLTVELGSNIRVNVDRSAIKFLESLLADFAQSLIEYFWNLRSVFVEKLLMDPVTLKFPIKGKCFIQLNTGSIH